MATAQRVACGTMIVTVLSLARRILYTFCILSWTMWMDVAYHSVSLGFIHFGFTSRKTCQHIGSLALLFVEMSDADSARV